MQPDINKIYGNFDGRLHSGKVVQTKGDPMLPEDFESFGGEIVWVTELESRAQMLRPVLQKPIQQIHRHPEMG